MEREHEKGTLCVFIEAVRQGTRELLPLAVYLRGGAEIPGSTPVGNGASLDWSSVFALEPSYRVLTGGEGVPHLGRLPLDKMQWSVAMRGEMRKAPIDENKPSGYIPLKSLEIYPWCTGFADICEGDVLMKDYAENAYRFTQALRSVISLHGIKVVFWHTK